VTSRQRIVVLAIAAVILVAGIVIASGSGSDDDDTAATQTTAQPAETTAETAPSEPENPATTTPTGTTEAAAPPPRVETVRIRGGAPTGEAKTLSFEKGDTVRLRFTSDQAVEAHVHGYDKTAEVPAGGTKRLTFKAEVEGIFEIENEGAGTLLAKLEVSPK